MSIFDSIKKINTHNQEFRSGRELLQVLEYTEWSKFLPVIARAKSACKNSGQNESLHFAYVSETLKSRNQYGETPGKKIEDVQLSRYACYLIAMEGDSRKSSIALAKSYFAIQTRNQEIEQQFLEDQKRLYLRQQVTEHNKNLAKTAKQAGVYNYGQFVDYGYIGLYGMKNKEILKTKGLKENDNLMDNIGSEELAANLFRATQAEAKIKRESIYGQERASNAHYEVGKEVRDTIKKIGGTMPELLSPSDPIKEAKKRLKK